MDGYDGNICGSTLATVLGAGTMGLVTVAALRHLTETGPIVCGARYLAQRELARELGPVGSNWLLSAAYPLDRYRDDLDHAAEAGRRGAAKVAFDMRQERRRGI